MAPALTGFPQALRRLRLRRRLTLTKARAATGVDASNLSRYETGKAVPELPTLEKILDGYGATLSELAHLMEAGDSETATSEDAAALPQSEFEEAVIKALKRIGLYPGDAQKKEG